MSGIYWACLYTVMIRRIGAARSWKETRPEAESIISSMVSVQVVGQSPVAWAMDYRIPRNDTFAI